MEYVLETSALTKRYRGFTALDSLTMRVPKGAIYGFVGRNGAGKTTLIRLICGLQEPTGGSFTLYGVRNTDARICRSRRRMGAVVETPSAYTDMTAEENLRQQYLVLGMPSTEGIPELLRLVGLEDTGKKKVKHFSLGMRQRLGIAVALAGNPDLLVLDEPVNGLDPQGIIEIRELVLKLNREHGITVLISSHILDELSRLATHYGAGESLPQMHPGVGQQHKRIGAGAGRHGSRLQHRGRFSGGYLQRGADHRAGGSAGPRRLHGLQRKGARRKSGKLLYGAGGR